MQSCLQNINVGLLGHTRHRRHRSGDTSAAVFSAPCVRLPPLLRREQIFLSEVAAVGCSGAGLGADTAACKHWNNVSRQSEYLASYPLDIARNMDIYSHYSTQKDWIYTLLLSHIMSLKRSWTLWQVDVDMDRNTVAFLCDFFVFSIKSKATRQKAR